ncbi:beta-galactosidase trimerization domain-containing protein [Candidatus Latescibacterota bacterium]
MPRYKDAAESELRFRQVHLDFHTSEHCPDVGNAFDPDIFADTLKAAHVNSVTCFARCHHGWSYHETSVGAMHPNLNRDLLFHMIESCHKRDINVPVYVTAGWDERAAREHPDWCEIKRDGTPNGAGPLEAGWRKLCFNTPYLDYLVAYTEEVVSKFDLDGLFMDIVWQEHCHCPCCLDGMAKDDLDPLSSIDLEIYAQRVMDNYYRRIGEVVASKKPGLRVFHNKGNVDKGRRDLIGHYSHWEIESLPTGGWGYDHFPGTARYSHAVGMDFLGMTGKFHTSWGEFGGYKTPNALLYECNLIIAMGGKVSVGDQLHPTGAIDDDTYRLIGTAYGDVAEKESWCKGAKPVPDVAIFSVESQHSRSFNYNNPKGNVDAGATRMLLESQIMFDVIDSSCDFAPYRTIILPDEVTVDDGLRDSLQKYLESGGTLLSSGTSGLNPDGTAFMLDIGADYEGDSEWEQDYIVTGSLGDDDIPSAPMLMYTRAVNLKVRDGDTLASIRPPYFNRAYNHFCSHRNTPYTTDDSPYPAAVRKGSIIHFAHRVFSAYRAQGQQYLRDMVMNALGLLCPVRRVEVHMPSGGRMTFMRQEAHDRWILHLLYAIPMHRGNNIDVIEDIVPLHDIACHVRIDRNPKRVYLAPFSDDINYSCENGELFFTVPEINRHVMVIIE